MIGFELRKFWYTAVKMLREEFSQVCKNTSKSNKNDKMTVSKDEWIEQGLPRSTRIYFCLKMFLN